MGLLRLIGRARRDQTREDAINLQDKIRNGDYWNDIDEYGEPLMEVPKARIVSGPDVNLDREPKEDYDDDTPSVVRVKRLR